MESIHGVLEWFLIILTVLAGFAVSRWMPFRRGRYVFNVLLLLTAFILDLNKVSFRSNILNFALYTLILLVTVEIFWVFVRRKNRLLLCGAFVALVPVFLYVYAAVLLILPLPCHENQVEVYGERGSCAAGTYKLTKRQSFDVFRPAQVYTLSRDIRYTPLKKQVDKFSAPKGYMEARFVPEWECQGNGKGRARLFIDGYVLWALEEKAEN